MASTDPTVSQSKQDPLAPVKSVALKGNPLRADISWQLLSIEAVAVFAVGIFALVNESSALRNVITLFGIFLLVDGLSCAIGEIRSSEPAGLRDKCRLIRAGIGMATGTIVVAERIFDFMDLTPTRVVVGIGLLGIGLVTVFGALATREELSLRFSGVGIALLLAAMGVVVLYQAASDNNSMTLFGIGAVIVGIGLAGLAYLRWRGTRTPGASPAPSTS